MSPRQRFQQNRELVTGYNDIVDSNRMQSAFDAAMLHFIDSLPTAVNHETAIAHAYRVEGARKFLDILKNLNTEASTTKTTSTALHHNV